MRQRELLTAAEQDALWRQAKVLMGAAYAVANATEPEHRLKEAASVAFQAMIATADTSAELLQVLQGITTAIGVWVGDHAPDDRETLMKTASLWMGTGMLTGAQDFLIDHPKGQA